MPLPIISANERLKEKRSVKLVLLGKTGIGKTSQLKTLPSDSTLFIDLEAGDLAVMDWPGDCVRPASWPEFRDLAVFLAGPNPHLPSDLAFSQAHYNFVQKTYGSPKSLAKYDTYFVDSISFLSRLCFTWCKTQPQAFSERTGRLDTRAAYNLLANELIHALTHLQHARGKNVIYVAILEERFDEANRPIYGIQLEGTKAGLELPSIVDEVITLAEIKSNDKAPERKFICHATNPWGFPAKDRSGVLSMMEQPNLWQLMEKITNFMRRGAGE